MEKDLKGKRIKTVKKSRRTEPRVIVFACIWHPYTAADNAGVGRFQYPPNAKIVGVNCVGTITSAFVLRAFRNGADGVLVMGCGAGDCHYFNGNESCERVVQEAARILEVSGINAGRLGLELSSEVDGEEFASTVEGFIKKIRAMEGNGGRDAR
mgnify:CR=1 FL=1